MKHQLITFLIWMVAIVMPVNGADFAMISDLGTSARHIAIGGVDGFSDAAESIFENPAGLYRVNGFSLSVFSSKVMNEVQYTNLALSTETPIGRLGVGFMEATVSNVPVTDATKQVINAQEVVNDVFIKDWFDYKNSLYKVAYQTRVLPQLEVGVSYVYYHQSYYSVSGHGSDLDVGMIYTQPNYEVSLLARNVLPDTKVVYNTGAYEPLPTQYVASMKRAFKWGLDVYPQVKYTQEQFLPSVGAKYTPNFLPFIHFMAGYKTFLTYTEGRKHNASFGIGLDLMGLTVYYAYERSDYALKDHKNYFSITTNF